MDTHPGYSLKAYPFAITVFKNEVICLPIVFHSYVFYWIKNNIKNSVADLGSVKDGSKFFAMCKRA